MTWTEGSRSACERRHSARAHQDATQGAPSANVRTVRTAPEPSRATYEEFTVTLTETPTKRAADNFEGGNMAVWCDDAMLHPDFPHEARLTYIAICKFAASRASATSKASKYPVGTARVGQATLAQCFGLNERTVRHHIQLLRDGGFLHVKSTGRSNIYTITGDRCLGRYPIVPPADLADDIPAEAKDLAAELIGQCPYLRTGQRTAHVLGKVVALLLRRGYSRDHLSSVMEEMLLDRGGVVPSVAECLDQLGERQ